MTILLFDSLDDIKAITGPDFETAVVPEERRRHLTRITRRPFITRSRIRIDVALPLQRRLGRSFLSA